MSERAVRSCVGKKAYNSERRANEAAKASQVIYGVKLNSYACTFCKRWHVGTTHPWEAKTARRENEAVIPSRHDRDTNGFGGSILAQATAEADAEEQAAYEKESTY